MTLVNLADNVHIIVSGEFPYCNTLVILDEELVVIDPGCRLESLRKLLSNNSLDLKDVDTVILSHIHPDHLTHAMRIHRLSDCRLAANVITAPLFNDKEKMKQYLGFTPEHPVRKSWEQLVDAKMFGALDDGKIDEELYDGDEMGVGNLTLRINYTPGHLPDHMCIEIVEINAIFAADIDCTAFGPFYGHPNSSIPDFLSSIRNLQTTNYDYYISGHTNKPIVEDYRRALAEYAQKIQYREDIIFASIANGAKTIIDIILMPVIYPSLANTVFMQFEKWMVEHHIKSLIDRGLVEVINNELVPVR
ncbi:MAG: MBL fold metallo-hydrolase [Candidatus Lokiarchaeota archaeon]|nr:MBL fold metallo-hydrolase [Candidatus Lokiarchaeota archaeon]